MSDIVNTLQVRVFEYIAQDLPEKPESKQVMGKISDEDCEMMSEEEIFNLTEEEEKELLTALEDVRPPTTLVIVKSSYPERGKYCTFDVSEKEVHNILHSPYKNYFSEENLDYYLLALPVAAIEK